MAMHSKFLLLLFTLLISLSVKAWNTPEKLTCQYGNGSNSRQCLLCNCVFETIGESTDGKLAVANTVFTRVNSPTHPIHSGPDTVCGIIYDRAQYSWTKNKSTVRKMSDVLNLKDEASHAKFKDCVNVTDAVMKHPPKKGPLWYHADYVKPAWAPKLKRVAKIGAHVFYTDPKSPQPSFDNQKVKTYLAALQSGKPAARSEAAPTRKPSQSVKKRASQ